MESEHPAQYARWWVGEYYNILTIIITIIVITLFLAFLGWDEQKDEMT